MFTGFRKERSDWQGKMLSGLMRILAEYENGYLEEMLGMLRPVYGEDSVLSIVSLEERTVLASTDECVLDIEYMARSIAELERKCYYLRNERNSIRYRKGINCIRVVPLVFRKAVSHVLIVEQTENLSVVADRCMEILALAVNTCILEQRLLTDSSTDSHTNLPNRDALVRDIPNIMGENALYLGFLSVRRSDVLAIGQTLEVYGRILDFVTRLLVEEYGKQVYCVGEGLFAVFKKGRSYDCVAALQDVMDKCISPNAIPVKGVLSFIGEDMLRALYQCERASIGASSEAVLFIRGRDVDVDTVEEMFYVSDAEKREEEMKVEDVVYEEVRDVKPRSDTEERRADEEKVAEAKQDLSFFFDVPDVDEILDDI